MLVLYFSRHRTQPLEIDTSGDRFQKVGMSDSTNNLQNILLNILQKSDDLKMKWRFCVQFKHRNCSSERLSWQHIIHFHNNLKKTLSVSQDFIHFVQVKIFN